MRSDKNVHYLKEMQGNAQNVHYLEKYKEMREACVQHLILRI